jgi:hypothetical protein
LAAARENNDKSLVPKITAHGLPVSASSSRS